MKAEIGFLAQILPVPDEELGQEYPDAPYDSFRVAELDWRTKNRYIALNGCSCEMDGDQDQAGCKEVSALAQEVGIHGVTFHTCHKHLHH